MSIELRGVTKQFGEFAAVVNINLDVPTGALIALLGPRAAARHSAAHHCGLETPDQGQVLFDGQDATRWLIRDRKVGFVFQHYALFRHMTVFENVAFVSKSDRAASGRPAQSCARRFVPCSSWCSSAGRATATGAAFRRPAAAVALARALAVDPAVLLLDEPFGALDSQVRHELRRWLRRLHDELHFTSVFVTHDSRRRSKWPMPSSCSIEAELNRAVFPVRSMICGLLLRAPLPRAGQRAAGAAAPGPRVPGPLDISVNAPPLGRQESIALIRPTRLNWPRTAGWSATVVAVRVIGPIVRLLLCAEGQPVNEPLEAEIGRERYEAERFATGQQVGLRFSAGRSILWMLSTRRLPMPQLEAEAACATGSPRRAAHGSIVSLHDQRRGHPCSLPRNSAVF